MKEREVDVAIIGAGTAGLSARREVAKVTDNYVVIDDGVLGTTCARVGCMPSKVLIQCANDYHRRHALSAEGIAGGEALSIDRAKTMEHVRTLRDRFVRSVIGGMESWQERLIAKRASFVDANTLKLTSNDGQGEEIVKAKAVVIGAGSSPIVPSAWKSVTDRLIDTNDFFELDELPERMAVVGLGVIGLELGQALNRLGVEVNAVTLDKRFGGLSDPEIQDYAAATFAEEFPIHYSAVKDIADNEGELRIALEDGSDIRADAALVAMGRRPNLAGLDLENLSLDPDSSVPEFDSQTFRIGNLPIYIAGDVNNVRPLLHEAADEGRIAGYNAVRSEDQCFRRRVPLTITFSEPNICVVGESYKEIQESGREVATGTVSYEGQGRAIVKLKEKGLLHIYGEMGTGKLLGAEMIAPQGEHLGHLLSWAISLGLSARDALSLPFYHPVLEEGVRTALRDLARKTKQPVTELEVLRCADPPVGVRA